MAYETVEAAIIHLESWDGYILWPLPLPDTIRVEELVKEDPKVFDELNPGDVVALYHYDETRMIYYRAEFTETGE